MLIMGGGIAIAGLLGAVFVPPAFVPVREGWITDVPIYAVIRVAWSCVLCGVICGVGVGLLLASVIAMKDKNGTEPAHAGDGSTRAR